MKKILAILLILTLSGCNYDKNSIALSLDHADKKAIYFQIGQLVEAENQAFKRCRNITKDEKIKCVIIVRDIRNKMANLANVLGKNKKIETYHHLKINYNHYSKRENVLADIFIWLQGVYKIDDDAIYELVIKNS